MGKKALGGVDTITTELLRFVQFTTITALWPEIWERNTWPQDQMISVRSIAKGKTREIVPITALLASSLCKICLKITHDLVPTTERELPDVQADFRRDCSNYDHIANLCWVREKSQKCDHNKL